MKIPISTTLCLALCGCAMLYDANRKSLLDAGSEADFGPPPPPGHQQMEHDLIHSIFRDSDRAKFSFKEDRKDVIPKSFSSPSAVAVWISQADVTFTNRSGAVTATFPFCFAWKDGRIIATSRAVNNANGRVAFWERIESKGDPESVAAAH